MKYNLVALAVFLLGCGVIAHFRIKWIKGIQDTSDAMIEGIASRLVLDLVVTAIFVWEWVRLPESLHPAILKFAFITAILLSWYALRRILRGKLQKRLKT